MQVEYTLYEDYLVAQNKRQDIYPKYTVRLSDLLLLNRVIKSIVHNDARYLQNLNTVASLKFVDQ
jgi:hypothetical protein